MIAIDAAAVELDGVTLLPTTTLTVATGSWHVVRGANGTGKSTLLSLVAGRRAPTSGTVKVADQSPNDSDPAFRSLVASLLGPPITARDLTVREHLTLIATSWDAPDPRAATDAELARWGITALAYRFAHELSSGQRQLFSLASVFIRPSGVLLLDEPEQRLDADRRAILVDTVTERRSDGTTVLMASHADDLSAAADEVTWLTQNA